MSYAESPDSVNFNTEKKLFYKLIDNQRQSGKKKLSSLHIEDRHVTSNSEIREGWAKYFKSIANPESPDNQSDKEYTIHIELNKVSLLCVRGRGRTIKLCEYRLQSVRHYLRCLRPLAASRMWDR